MLQWPTASSLFPYTTLFRSVGPQLVRELGRRPHGELAVRELALVVAAKLRGDTARLHGHRHDALVDDTRADHPVGAPERPVDVAAAAGQIVFDIIRELLVHAGGALLHRLLEVDDRRARLVRDVDKPQRVLG